MTLPFLASQMTTPERSSAATFTNPVSRKATYPALPAGLVTRFIALVGSAPWRNRIGSLALITPLLSLALVASGSASSTHTTQPCVPLPSQAGVAALGSALKHISVGKRRFTDSARARCTAASMSFAAAVIWLERMNWVRPGTPIPMSTPVSASTISSSNSVKPRGMEGAARMYRVPCMGADYIDGLSVE